MLEQPAVISDVQQCLPRNREAVHASGGCVDDSPSLNLAGPDAYRRVQLSVDEHVGAFTPIVEIDASLRGCGVGDFDRSIWMKAVIREDNEFLRYSLQRI